MWNDLFVAHCTDVQRMPDRTMHTNGGICAYRMRPQSHVDDQWDKIIPSGYVIYKHWSIGLTWIVDVQFIELLSFPCDYGKSWFSCNTRYNGTRCEIRESKITVTEKQYSITESTIYSKILIIAGSVWKACNHLSVATLLSENRFLVTLCFVVQYVCCTDVNECLSNPCINNGTCSDQIDGYNCTCIPGYNGTRYETSESEMNSKQYSFIKSSGL